MRPEVPNITSKLIALRDLKSFKEFGSPEISQTPEGIELLPRVNKLRSCPFLRRRKQVVLLKTSSAHDQNLHSL